MAARAALETYELLRNILLYVLACELPRFITVTKAWSHQIRTRNPIYEARCPTATLIPADDPLSENNIATEQRHSPSDDTVAADTEIQFRL